MASPDTANVTTGPGTLMYAPLGTDEPTTRAEAWPAGWVAVGYTAEGHSFSSSLSIDDVEVAELLDPVRRVTTKRDTKVAFAMAEITLAHLKFLLNGGTITADGVIGSIYEPPQVGAEVRSMLGWDSEDGLERIIWRRVLQSGNSEIARRKGADFAKFNAEFSLEQPGGGVAPFRWFFETDRVAA